MPLRRVRHSSRASAVSSLPSRTAMRKSIEAAAATVDSLAVLQAKANALSASAKTRAPWHAPWPLTMSARTFMSTRAPPGCTASRRMPSICEAPSRAKSAAAARSARRWRRAASLCPLMATPSASAEAGRALLAESSDALRIISAASQLALQVPLDVELLGKGATPALVECLLVARQAARRPHSELPRQGVDDACELRVLDAPPDEAPGGRLFGR